MVAGVFGEGPVVLVADRLPVEDGGKGAESRSKFVTIFSRDGEVNCCRCEVFDETRLSGGSSCCSAIGSRLFDDDEPGS